MGFIVRNGEIYFYICNGGWMLTRTLHGPKSLGQARLFFTLHSAEKWNKLVAIYFL